MTFTPCDLPDWSRVDEGRRTVAPVALATISSERVFRYQSLGNNREFGDVYLRLGVRYALSWSDDDPIVIRRVWG